MTKKAKPQAEGVGQQNTSREVVPSQPVSIEVAGGYIEGKFIKTMTRLSKHGEDYTGHVIEATKATVVNREDGKPLALNAGRYFVFGRTRLDRLMREVERGERVRITYEGKKPNEGGEGEHHAFTVMLLD